LKRQERDGTVTVAEPIDNDADRTRRDTAMGWFLGLDSSTQSLSATLIDAEKGTVAAEYGVNFGTDLPEYSCPQGFLEHPDPLVKHSDPLMWAAALDLLLTNMANDDVDFACISGISGSGQQHGTVYLNATSLSRATWESGASLVERVTPMLSRETAPIWMDSATSPECAEITAAAGGADVIRQRTGSSAVERFSGPQVRRFWRTAPGEYDQTAVIHLVSSFMCSLLIGGNAPIDCGDGAGMNLLNLAAADWDPVLLNATAPGLAAKLPPVVSADQVVGAICPYFVQRYGFTPGTPVVAWSGDNPNSLVGVGGWRAGVAVISLGTSDTYFAAMTNPTVDPDGYGHVFGNPAGGFMSLICFKNGALAREAVKDEFGLSWAEFDVDAFADTPAGNNGNMMLPYFVPEITPLVLESGPAYRGDDAFVQGRTPAQRVRAIVEAQAMSLRLHSQWIQDEADTLRVTGGGSKSPGICQVLADVFDAKVERLETGNSAGLGAAMRAANGVRHIPWSELSEQFCGAVKGKDVLPIPESVATYSRQFPAFQAYVEERTKG
jgi:xylulokinase